MRPPKWRRVACNSRDWDGSSLASRSSNQGHDTSHGDPQTQDDSADREQETERLDASRADQSGGHTESDRADRADDADHGVGQGMPTEHCQRCHGEGEKGVGNQTHGHVGAEQQGCLAGQYGIPVRESTKVEDTFDDEQRRPDRDSSNRDGGTVRGALGIGGGG